MLGFGAVGELALGETGEAGAGSIIPTGITSAEAFGTPVFTTFFVLDAGGIGSEEVFGTTLVNTLNPTGIASEETFGTPEFTSFFILSVGNIVSAESFGAVVVSYTEGDMGIPSAEAFGSPVVYTPIYYTPLSRIY